jgi:DNA topoisomerase-3
MPDYEYRQTVIKMNVPVPDRQEIKSAQFRAVGRIPLKSGWKAAFGTVDTDETSAKPDKEAEQTLPQLSNGDRATLSRPRVQSKKTQPPPRYSEGTLIDAMQNAWRFVEDDALRDRLKEAKGIGTPATRAGILTGLRQQNLLMATGKNIVPTPAGLQLFELLRSAVPTLVDPGTTAIWEMRLDDVVLGKADYRAVIDEIAGEADRLIAVLRRHNGGKVDLGKPASKSRTRSAAKRAPRASDSNGKAKAAKSAARGARANERPTTRTGGGAHAGRQMANGSGTAKRDQSMPNAKQPTDKMIAFAERIARDRQARLPQGYDRDFDVCRRFLDEYVGGSAPVVR